MAKLETLCRTADQFDMQQTKSKYRDVQIEKLTILGGLMHNARMSDCIFLLCTLIITGEPSTSIHVHG